MSTYTGLHEPSSVLGGGIGPDIVRTLKAYDRALPLPFLAHVLRRSQTELEQDILRLEQSHVLRRQGELVQLSR